MTYQDVIAMGETLDEEDRQRKLAASRQRRR